MRKPTIKQYSKRVVSAMVLAWFAGIAFGMGVIVWQMIRAPDAVSRRWAAGSPGILQNQHSKTGKQSRQSISRNTII